MYSFEYKEKTYEVAESWAEVTIRQAIAYNYIPTILAIGDLEGEEQETGVVEHLCWAVGAFSTLPVEYSPADVIESMPDRWPAFMKAISFIYEPMQLPRNQSQFTHNGRTYEGQDPFTAEPLGKYINIERRLLKVETLIKRINDCDISSLPEFIAVIVSERRHRYELGRGLTNELFYDGTETALAERTAEFRDMRLLDALALRGFFLQSWKTFASVTLTSTKPIPLLSRMRRNFRTVGVGLTLLTRWLTVTSKSTLK